MNQWKLMKVTALQQCSIDVHDAGVKEFLALCQHESHLSFIPTGRNECMLKSVFCFSLFGAGQFCQHCQLNIMY